MQWLENSVLAVCAWVLQAAMCTPLCTQDSAQEHLGEYRLLGKYCTYTTLSLHELPMLLWHLKFSEQWMHRLCYSGVWRGVAPVFRRSLTRLSSRWNILIWSLPNIPQNLNLDTAFLCRCCLNGQKMWPVRSTTEMHYVHLPVRFVQLHWCT
jgi:hypothetical protein